MGAGIPMAWNAIQWKKDEITASRAREYKYPPVFVMANSHAFRTCRCFSGRNREQIDRRNFGQSATK